MRCPSGHVLSHPFAYALLEQHEQNGYTWETLERDYHEQLPMCCFDALKRFQPSSADIQQRQMWLRRNTPSGACPFVFNHTHDDVVMSSAAAADTNNSETKMVLPSLASVEELQHALFGVFNDKHYRNVKQQRVVDDFVLHSSRAFEPVTALVRPTMAPPQLTDEEQEHIFGWLLQKKK